MSATPPPSPIFRLLRGVVEALSATVSTSVFATFKSPGNSYVVFFPTSLLPALDNDAAVRDPRVGARICRAFSAEGHGPVCVAMYDSTAIYVPWTSTGGVRVWPPPRWRKGLPSLPRSFTTTSDKRERLAIRHILAAIDVDWLRKNGQPDPDMTRRVLDWLAEIEKAVVEMPGRVRFPFPDETFEPHAAFRVDIETEQDFRKQVWIPGAHRHLHHLAPPHKPWWME